jgi:hypothetical protein
MISSPLENPSVCPLIGHLRKDSPNSSSYITTFTTPISITTTTTWSYFTLFKLWISVRSNLETLHKYNNRGNTWQYFCKNGSFVKTFLGLFPMVYPAKIQIGESEYRMKKTHSIAGLGVLTSTFII